MFANMLCICTMCVWCSHRSEKVIRSPTSYLSHGCWELSPGPLQGQQVLLSLQSLQPSPQASRVGSWETSLAAARRAAEGGGKRKTGKESVGPAVGVTEGGRGGDRPRYRDGEKMPDPSGQIRCGLKREESRSAPRI